MDPLPETDMARFLAVYQSLIALPPVSDEDLTQMLRSLDPFTLGAEGPSHKEPVRKGLRMLVVWGNARGVVPVRATLLNAVEDELRQREEFRSQAKKAFDEAAWIGPEPAPQQLLVHLGDLERL